MCSVGMRLQTRGRVHRHLAGDLGLCRHGAVPPLRISLPPRPGLPIVHARSTQAYFLPPVFSPRLLPVLLPALMSNASFADTVTSVLVLQAEFIIPSCVAGYT